MNTERKHTPGQWAVSKIGNNYEHFEVYQSLGGSTICNTVYGEANAQLIAAAPELLQALMQCIHSVEHEGVEHGRVVGAVRNAKAAINKALGNQ